jgi:hypothetical protein
MRRLSPGCAAAAVVLFAFSAVPTLAACGTGNPPSYDDITGVQFEHSDCSAFAPKEVKLTCSSYSVFITNWGHQQIEARRYEQFAPASEVGDYRLNVSAGDVVAILRQHRFFELNPANIGETDVPYTVLAVKHCAIVTRLSLPPEHPSGAYTRGEGDFDSATQALFDAIDAFIRKAPKTLVSRKPQYNEVNWDGWL